MPAPQNRSAERDPRRTNEKGDPSRANDPAALASLMLPTHRISLVSRTHHTLRQYSRFICLFMQCFSSHLHQFSVRRRPSNHLPLQCQVHYSRVHHPCFQTFPLYFKLRAFKASLTMCHHPPLNNPMLFEPKSTQCWKTTTSKLTSVQVHYLSGSDTNYL